MSVSTPGEVSAAPKEAPADPLRSVTGDESASTLSCLPSARRWLLHLLILAGLSVLVMITCLQFGAERIGLEETLRILAMTLQGGHGAEASSPAAVILMQVRLPRIILAFLVGGSLAGVGAALQALLRNPLADPYILGISSGAALGAAIAVLLGLGVTAFSFSTVPVFAFVGGVVSILLVYRIAAIYRYVSIHTLLLAGVILNAIFSALIMFITSIMDPNRSFGMMAWLMGNLTGPTLASLSILAIYLIGGGIVLLLQARQLNILTLGEEPARSLGVDVEGVKRTIFFTAALLTGAAVSVSGLIGFVGMVVPHGVRMVLGSDHRLLLPASALVGGMFLLMADTVARSIMAPSELPVGVVTALVGGPVFIYMLTARKGTSIQ